MKAKISAIDNDCFDEAMDYVWVHPGRAPLEDRLMTCRKHMSRLLRGTGKRLPRHGTDEVVEIELTAK